ncbi:Hypothetical predicted protein [Olea europaea subsp. europaea]|uniref:Uncharacterized protein n=1 Tax=Olea europaea subsp. europaea TaxID=158383 RepID=A0A8S0PRK9_OLEEU|nr:Hypothetical predicted protein [Olea europaea subsp. europaea]
MAKKAPKGPIPSPSVSNHVATYSRYSSRLNSPLIANGFGIETPMPSPQSQSFSRSYGSILLTFFAYIVPLIRGCSPWTPDTVMSTIGSGRYSILQIFKGRRGCTRHHETCSGLPATGPYLRLSNFLSGQIEDSHLSSSYPEENFEENQLLDGSISLLPLYPSQTNDLHVSITMGLHQSFLWLHPAQAQFTIFWVPIGMFALKPFSKDLGQSTLHPSRRSHQLASLSLRVYSSIDSYTCQTPWSVFQDGSNGEHVGQYRECTGVVAC